MNVTINGKSDTVDGTVTVLELLKLKDVEAPDMVSVQVNGEIVEKEKFGATRIGENDEIEFLYFMGGGSRSVGGGRSVGGSGALRVRSAERAE